MKPLLFLLFLFLLNPLFAQYSGLGDDLEKLENNFSYYKENYPDWKFTKLLNNDNQIIECRVHKFDAFVPLILGKTEIIDIYKFQNGICTSRIRQFPKEESIIEIFEKDYKEYSIQDYYFIQNQRQDFQKIAQVKSIDSIPSIFTTLIEFIELPKEVNDEIERIRPQGDYVQKSDHQILNKPILLRRLNKESHINGTYEDQYGNVLRIAELTDGKLMFIFNVGNSRNFSELEGLIQLQGNSALYEDDEFGSCVAKFTIEKNRITVNSYQNNCGLASGLTLAGIYTQQNNQVPNFESYN